MAQFDEQDDIHSMERPDTSKKLPLGWVLLFVGLIVWGIYYFVAYTPDISGWTQYNALEEVMKGK